MSSNKVDIHDKATTPRGDRGDRQVIDAVRAIRYGSVEIVVHDGRVVQIESRVKVRLDATDRRPDDPGRMNGEEEKNR
jgi:hypothetical protein